MAARTKTAPAPAAEPEKKSASRPRKTAADENGAEQAKSSGASIDQFLAKAQANWKKNIEAAKEFGAGRKLPDGRVVAKFSGGEARIHNERPTVVFIFTVIEGKHKGKEVRKYINLDMEWSYDQLAGDLMALEVDVDSLELKSLNKIMKQLAKDAPAVRLNLVTNDKGYQNKYIDQFLGADYEPDETDDEEDEDVEDEDTEGPEDEEDEEDEDVEDEEEDEEEGEDEGEITEGATVAFMWKGEELEPGTVKSVEEDTGKVKISYEGKVYVTTSDKVTLLVDSDEDEDEEEEEPEPPKRGRGRPRKEETVAAGKGRRR